MTGGRIKRVEKYLDDEDFCCTYGDGVGNINIGKLIRFHSESNLLATLTATQPPGRFGALNLSGNTVQSFQEKPISNDGWINGGFFVLSPKVLDYIEGDSTVWEEAPLQNLAAENQLNAYLHHDFWQPMDTLRDKNHLEDLWESEQAPWKTWP